MARKKKEDARVGERVAKALIRGRQRVEISEFVACCVHIHRHIHILDTEILFQNAHRSRCSSQKVH